MPQKRAIKKKGAEEQQPWQCDSWRERSRELGNAQNGKAEEVPGEGKKMGAEPFILHCFRLHLGKRRKEKTVPD